MIQNRFVSMHKLILQIAIKKEKLVYHINTHCRISLKVRKAYGWVYINDCRFQLGICESTLTIGTIILRSKHL